MHREAWDALVACGMVSQCKFMAKYWVARVQIMPFPFTPVLVVSDWPHMHPAESTAVQKPAPCPRQSSLGLALNTPPVQGKKVLDLSEIGICSQGLVAASRGAASVKCVTENHRFSRFASYNIWLNEMDDKVSVVQLGDKSLRPGFDLIVGEPELLGKGTQSPSVAFGLARMLLSHSGSLVISTSIPDPDTFSQHACDQFKMQGFRGSIVHTMPMPKKDWYFGHVNTKLLGPGGIPLEHLSDGIRMDLMNLQREPYEMVSDAVAFYWRDDDTPQQACGHVNMINDPKAFDLVDANVPPEKRACSHNRHGAQDCPRLWLLNGHSIAS